MRGTVAVIVTLLIAAIVGVGAYELGVAQGAAGAGGAVAPVGYYHPFFWGFPLFGLLFPLLFFFLLFGLARAAFGGWRGGWGYGRYADERRARLEELHRQMHGEAPREGGTTTPTPPTGR
jgi:hypothetical protein